MPIDVVCSGCKNRLRVGDQNAGKRVRCPKCQTVVEVPANGWYLKTPDGEDFGPVPKSEMDQWLAEGRVTAECQLLREGAEQWQWASDVYPQLAAPTAAPEPPSPFPADKPSATPQFSANAAGPSGQIAFGPGMPASTAASPGGFPFEAPAAGAPSGFRSRSYPAADLAQKMYRLFGWLAIGVGVLAALGTVVMTLPALTLADGAVAKVGTLLTALFVIVWIALYTGISVITLWFLSDAIRMMLDIQSNTHKSSYFLQQMQVEKRVDE